MQLLPADPAHWPARPCALQQHPAYGRAVARLGADVAQYRLAGPGGELAWMQVIRRRLGPLRLCWLARGPLWHVPTGAAERAQALATLGHALPGLPLVMPDTAADAAALRGAGLRPLLTPQSVAEIDLTAPEGTRLSGQHGKWRNRLRRARGQSLDIIHRPLDMGRDAPLLSRELAQRKARRYNALPPAFTAAWAAGGGDGTRLFLARRNGATLAFLLLLLHPPGATYHIGWTGAEGRATCAHHLLLWRASLWLAGRGFERLDLGSLDSENTPGLARFKLGSGAAPRALGPTLLRLPGPGPRRAAARHAFPLAISRPRR